MRIFGLNISRQKSQTVYGDQGGGLWGTIREGFAGAWQRGIVTESRENILAFSAVYACVSLIADDISKLPFCLKQQDSVGGIWKEISSSSFTPVLTKPNRYQTRIQFVSQWITSKLLYGNAYILKARDNRGIVTDLYVLDPRYVTAKVADSGDIFYDLNRNNLAGVGDTITIPASEIIHDRCVTLFHPLIGVSPIYACASSATQGIRIQSNSETFFANMSRPSGQLTAAGEIPDSLAKRLKEEFENNFSGGRLGRIFVAGNGLHYEPMTIPAADAQLIEQLKWTVEDVARCFKVPLYKMGGPLPTFNNAVVLNQDYYTQALQCHIEGMELLLDEGLGLVDVPGKTYGVEMDVDCLLRMDPLTAAQVDAELIKAAILSPNEGRAKRDLAPVKGGDSPMAQQQNFSLAALDKRDSLPNPFVIDRPAPNPTPSPSGPAVEADPSKLPAPADQSAKRLYDALVKRLNAAARIPTAMHG